MVNESIKLCVASFEMQVEFGEYAEAPGVWQAVFYLKDVKVVANIVSAAKSIFTLLYNEARCIGNNAISFRVTSIENDTEINQLFVLSMNEDSPMEELDERAISHSSANLSKGTLKFFFNNPQALQIEKIMRVLSNIIPFRCEAEENEGYIMPIVNSAIDQLTYAVSGPKK